MNFFNRAVTDRRLGIAVCDLVASLYDANPEEALGGVWRFMTETAPDDQLFIRGTDAFPSMYFCSGGDNGLFVCGGTESLQQGVSLAAGYGPDNILDNPPIVNKYLAQMVAAVEDLPVVQRVLRKPDLFLCGHSLGGALCLPMALLHTTAAPGNTVKIVSLGAPKAVKPQWMNRINNAFICRWMNDDDPVPLVYPLPDDDFLLAMVSGLRFSLYASEFTQSRGGLELDANGNESAQLLPRRAALNTVGNLAAWLYAIQQRNPHPHNLNEYRRRLSLHLPADPAAMEQPVETSRGGIISPLTLTEIRRQNSATGRAVFAQSRGQSSAPLVIPPSKIFRKLKIGGVWYTSFGDKLIAIGPSRRKAGNLAVRGNEFISGLLRQGLVSPEAMVNQWADFVEYARNPLNPISPHLKTDLPPIAQP